MDDVFAFFNIEKWSGNLIITHFRWANVEAEINKASQYIQSELENNSNAVMIKLNEWNVAFCDKETKDGNII
jgi:Domain of unknown function (DUF3805)